MRVFILILISFFILFSCASKPPAKQENICSIFEQKSSWYRLANKSYEKWGAPIHVQMSILRQESAFQNRVKPERTKILGVIPWKRKSSAFGYTQAIDATWDWYRTENKKPLASRVNFADAIDFTGWYINKSNKINGISKSDAYSQYLAYHEGHGGYKKKSYKNHNWLIDVANKVKLRSDSIEASSMSVSTNLRKSF